MKHDKRPEAAPREAAPAVQARAASPDRSALKGMNYEQGAAAVAPPKDQAPGRLVPEIAAEGVGGAGGAMPHAEAIQASFGKHDIGDVKAHVGGEGGAAAQEMGAEAYATGNDVAFDGAPSKATAAHEAAHVVQQRAGLKPAGGVGTPGDAYEKHADEVADLVVRGESAEGKLDDMAGSGGGGEMGPSVQQKNTGIPITSLDKASVDKMIAGLRATAAWIELVDLWRMVTEGGTVPISPNDREDITLEVLILVEKAFSFSGDASVDALWEDPVLIGRFLSSIEQSAKPAGDKPDEEGDKPAAKPVVLPNPGTFGIITADTELLTESGETVALKEGESVETLRGLDGKLVVEVLTRPKGKVGTVDPELFKPQPKLSNDDDGHMEDYAYKKYEGELFLARGDVKEPSIMDVDQGALGDCYLISAMGAVAASNPDVIKNMISYDAATGQYTVTFQEMQRGGKFKPHVEVVDAYMPTRRGTSRMAYAMSDASFNPANQALWPAIIEKAYAQWKGDYEEIGGGGSSAEAMESFTGVRSTNESMPRAKDVVARFQQWQTENKAVVCGTLDWKDQRSIEGLFSGSETGPYTGKLTDHEGLGAEVVKGSVSIRDRAGTAGSARDDKKGALTGTNVDSGEVQYEGGSTRLTFKDGKAPAAAADLLATYQFEGTLNQGLNLHGDHAYMFREVKDGLIYFNNPWGPAASKHPKGLTGEQFREYFQTIGVNATIPQQNDR